MNELREVVNDFRLWIKRRLQDLKYKDTSHTTSTGFVVQNGFAYAEIPEWELRQKLEAAEAALNDSETTTKG